MHSIKRKIVMLFLLTKEIFNRCVCKIRVKNSIDTLSKIIAEKKSVSRFGDGEFNILLQDNLVFQNYDENLRKRMLNVLHDADNNGDCLICIPYALSSLKGFTLKSSFFWLKYFAKKRKVIEQFLNRNAIYYDAQITRFYINRKNKKDAEYLFGMWKAVWNNMRILVVEGSKTRFGVNNSLFDNASSVRRIICPSENAFEYYDEIYNGVVDVKDFDLCILALGPTATVMAYDLSKAGIWTIDSGNMDMEYEWMKKRATRKIAIYGKYTLEASKGTEVSDCNDEEYKKQIIKSIGCI